MTFGIRNLVAFRALRNGDTAKREGFFGTKEPLFGKTWEQVVLCPAFFSFEDEPWTLADVYTYLIGAHVGHSLDFMVTLLCYMLLYADGHWLQEAKEWQVAWVARIFLYNLVSEVVLYSFWHYTTYVSRVHDCLVAAGKKYNIEMQYEPSMPKARMFASSTGHLEREIFFNTLGWLQSAAWQVFFTHMWATGAIPIYTDFFAKPVRSFLLLFAIAYWREVHFFCAHRCMHPWWASENTIWDGDIGAFLYRHVHSLHHKSYNPGPWAGLAMHPVEHFLYYSAAWLPALFLYIHPFHFLYTKFHADIAPLGGHDGMEDPGGDADFHYLHHAKFECNYGVPFPINLDKLFGTWVDWKASKEAGAQDDAEAIQKNEKTTPLLASDQRAQGKETFTMEEVAEHRFCENCWIVLYGQVINVSSFLKVHPGGEKVLMTMAGKDATSTFEKIHASSGGWRLVSRWLPDGVIGTIRGWDGPLPPQSAEDWVRFPGPQLLFALLGALTLVVAM